MSSPYAPPEIPVGPLTVSGRVSDPLTISLPAGASPTVDSRTLLGKQGEIRILHNNRVYRLRVTMSGKLILTA